MRAVANIFLIQRQRSPAAPCAPYGGTPCWAVHLVFGCSALAHCSQCDSVVAFLCIVDVEGPLHVRQPVIHMPNVSVHRRRLVRRTVERLVGIYVLAVHALDLFEIVAPSSMLFAGGWWRIHFTCGSPYILIPTSAFTFGAPCAP